MSERLEKLLSNTKSRFDCLNDYATTKEKIDNAIFTHKTFVSSVREFFNFMGEKNEK